MKIQHGILKKTLRHFIKHCRFIMEYKKTRYAVVKEPNPESALYFEHAYSLYGTPLGSMTTASDIFAPKEPTIIENFILSPEKAIGNNHWDSKTEITRNAIDIIRNNFITNSYTNGFLKKIEKSINKYGGDIYGDRNVLITDFIKINEEIDSNTFDKNIFLDNLMITATTAYYRGKGLYTVPVLENTDSPNWMRGNNLEDGIELALLDIPLVKNKNMEWEQVYEVRKDRNSIEQLRNLRLFLDGLDHKKGKDYVQDILLKKIENYENSAKKHGFKLSKGPLKAMLNLKHIPKLLSYGVCALISPGMTSIEAVMAGLSSAEIGGAIKEIGDISISLKEQKVLKGLEGEHKDIEYLVSIKNKLH